MSKYEGADVFVICVASDDKESYNNIKSWKEEISEKEPSKPICVILSKIDRLKD